MRCMRESTRRRICIFCGSLSGDDASYRALAQETARAIAAAGYGIVYGGGGIGLMGVIADAALAEGGEVVGIIPQALARAEVAHRGLSELHVVEGMHERKALMLQLSDAFMVLPGGFGTMDELCEALSWRQLGIHDRPVGILNYRGYFDDLLSMFDTMVERGFLSPRHRKLVVDATAIQPLMKAMFGPDASAPKP